MQEIHALCDPTIADGDLARLLGGYATVQMHCDIESLSAAIAPMRDVAVVIDARGRDPESMSALLQLLGTRHPHFPVIGRVGPDYDEFTLALSAVEAGLVGVWVAGLEDSPAAVRHVFDHSIARAVTRSLATSVEAIAHPSVRSFIRFCFHHVMRSMTVGSATERIGVNSRTLARALRAYELPRAESLIVAARALVATRLLHNERRRVASVGAAMEVKDVKVLRRQLARLAGVRFVVERNLDAYDRQMAVWNEWLRHAATPRMDLPDE